jgi:AcrR family transcriptional regulator
MAWRRPAVNGEGDPMNPTRERLLDVSAALFAHQGVTGTGIKQILTEAGAPFSSLYHHFPGGKEELAAESVLRAGRIYGQLLPAVFDPAEDVVAGVRDFFDGASQVLIETAFADACPIATVALEASSTNEPIRRACATVFEEWIASGIERFVGAGMNAVTARHLAITMIGSLEGAFVLARALRSVEPLSVARDTVVRAVAVAIGAPLPT